MSKVNAKSADVLNDADDFERRLDWMLFHQEQNAMLWDDDPTQKWRPGLPMFPHPHSRIDSMGEYVRAMFEEMELDRFHCRAVKYVYVGNQEYWYPDDPDHLESVEWRILGENLSAPFPRCTYCYVSWTGPEPCWMCGEVCPSPSIGNPLQFFGIETIESTEVPREAFQLLNEPTPSVVGRLPVVWVHNIDRPIGHMTDVERLSAEDLPFFTPDEMRGWIHGMLDEIFTRPPLEIEDGPLAHFIIDREGLWSEPIAQPPHFQLPDDLDLSRRIPPVRPEGPFNRPSVIQQGRGDNRQWTSINPPITQQRRTR